MTCRPRAGPYTPEPQAVQRRGPWRKNEQKQRYSVQWELLTFADLSSIRRRVSSDWAENADGKGDGVVFAWRAESASTQSSAISVGACGAVTTAVLSRRFLISSVCALRAQ